jgi:hypothetical protein
LDVQDLTARLETDGVTDSVATAEFGHESARRMAENWLPRVLTYGPAIEPPPAERGWLQEYADGIVFSIPLLCSCLSMLSLGFALWGGALPNDDATAVGLGTVGSFLLSGGIVQAMVRRGLFFATTQQFVLCASAIRYWLGVGALFIAAGAVTMSAASAYWGWLPMRVNFVAAAFCLALGVLWLAAGALYILRNGLPLIWLNLAGIGLVWLLHVAWGLSLIAAQLIALTACNGAALTLVLRRLRQTGGRTSYRDATWSLAREVYSVWPFVLYGLLYYVLLFGDRLAAWTADTYAASLPVQFRGDYETAVNVGLFVFVLLAGWIHCATAAFYSVIARSQRTYRVSETEEFRSEVFGFYKKFALTVAAFGTGASLATFGGAYASGLLGGSATTSIAAWSLAGYVLLMLGLWNVNLLFGLSSPSAAVRSAAVGCLANLAIGYIFSRVGGYEHAVFGFLGGGVAFAALSTMDVMRAFRELDYRYFAAA